MIKMHKLGVILSLSDLAYRVRPKGHGGAGHMFYSESIAWAWAREQVALTGRPHDIFEMQVGF